MADKLSGQAQVQPPDDAATLVRRFAGAAEPAWLWDRRRHRIVWGNAAAVRFWHAGSALDLIEYRFVESSPEARLANGLRGGEEREAMLASNGEPLRARVRAEDAVLFDGSEGVLVRIVETLTAQSDPAIAAKAMLFDAAPIALMMVDGAGRVSQRNDAAREFSEALAGDLFAKLAGQALAQGAANCITTLSLEGREHTLRLFAARLDDAPGVIVRIDDVSDRRALETSMARATHATEKREAAAPKSKADFVSQLSHEMRNPLNAILGFSEIMQQRRFGPLGNHRYESYIDDIHMSAAHLLDLVNDLLDIGRLADGRFKIDFEAVSLAAIVGECTRMLKLQADEAGISLEIAVPSSLPAVVADARAMRQLVLNVMSNAVKFTPEGGEVGVLGAIDSEGGVRLCIVDTGVGMSEEELKLAMEPYGQVESALQGKRKGTGLGLPLAKALADANKCGFRIRSVPKGGTQVELSFPPARVLAG
jgi:signal transduction histidine kinase